MMAKQKLSREVIAAHFIDWFYDRAPKGLVLPPATIMQFCKGLETGCALVLRDTPDEWRCQFAPNIENITKL